MVTDSFLSVFDGSYFGSTVSVTAVSKLGSSLSILSGTRVGRNIAVMSEVLVGSAISVQLGTRFGSSLSVRQDYDLGRAILSLMQLRWCRRFLCESLSVFGASCLEHRPLYQVLSLSVSGCQVLLGFDVSGRPVASDRREFIYHAGVSLAIFELLSCAGKCRDSQESRRYDEANRHPTDAAAQFPALPLRPPGWYGAKFQKIACELCVFFLEPLGEEYLCIRTFLA
jgi:hypothetical protein